MKKPQVIFASLLLLAGLAYGVTHLLVVRFAQGDVYPPYSTLRADGLGSEALYDSLAELMPVSRNYKDLVEFHPAKKGNTFFMLGVMDGFEDDPDTAVELERLARDGNRVVMTFSPVQSTPYRSTPYGSTATPSPTPDKSASPEKSGTNRPAKKTKKQEMAALRTRWGASTAYFSKLPKEATAEAGGLEPKLSWHSLMYFKDTDPDWHVLYSCDGKPVVIERQFGEGSVVLAADSYFSSNEALSKERAPDFLSALAGNSTAMIFDETHLGVEEQQGVASLARKYHLHYAVMALACVAALFVWRNLVPFVPRRDEEIAADEVVRGFDASTAFVSLLKRNIPLDKIIATCLAEWKRSLGHRAKPALVASVEAAAAAGAKKPVETFQTITQILNEKK